MKKIRFIDVNGVEKIETRKSDPSINEIAEFIGGTVSRFEILLKGGLKPKRGWMWVDEERWSKGLPVNQTADQIVLDSALLMKRAIDLNNFMRGNVVVVWTEKG